MKKIIVSVSAAVAMIVCCLFSFNALANEPHAPSKIDISSAHVTTNYKSYIYTGNKIEAGVKVKLNVAGENEENKEITLKYKKDFTVSYSNNVNAGTAKVTVNGVGEYIGKAYTTFKITPRSASDKNFKIKFNSRTYPGKNPNFTVTYASKKLAKGKDFIYSVSNNKKAGYNTATLKVTGKGNFKGSKSVKFIIYPTKVSGVKAKNINTNSLYLSWNSKSSEGVSGYKVYKASNAYGKNLKLLKKTSSTHATINNLDSSTPYIIFVAAYKTNNDKTARGDLSNVSVVCTKPKTVKLNYVVVRNSKKIFADWNKVYNASGYQIQYSQDKNFKKGVRNAYVKGSRGDSAIAVSSSNKAYYVRVRAYRNYNVYGKKRTSYGSWSAKMSSLFDKVYKQYTTNYPSNKNRTTNLKLACKAINGTIVKPGDTFSFNKTVGERTAKKGYKPATIFLGSTGQAKEVGGGICQVASTMYNAALLSNFGIVERHQHSQKITYCPLGRDAAIFWGSYDFKFKNNTNYPIMIKMSCANGKLTCKYMVSYNVKAPKVSLSVNRKGKNYTLKRKVNGKVNYTAHSYY